MKKKQGKARWLILLVICFMYLITFMDRTNISIAAPYISKEFEFNQVTMGFIFSAFTWAYAIGQVPGGWLGDKFGPRNILTIIVSFWSLMTMVTAHAVGYYSFLIIRFLFGLGEAGAFPTATRAMQLWFAKEERGFVQGLTHAFSRLGAAIVPPLAVSIIALWGWRSLFYIFGAAGIIWAILFFIVYRNIPEEHKWVKREELIYIRGLDEKGNVNKPINLKNNAKVPWKAIFSSSNMWFLMIVWFCWNYANYFFITWLPTYLLEYRHFSIVKMGFLASLPLLAGMVGDLVGGFVSDKVLKKSNSIKLARKIVAIPGLVGAAICLIPAATIENPLMSVYCFSASAFFLECVNSTTWATAMDVGGEYSGTVSGVMNMAGNIAGALSPIIFGILVQGGSWNLPFYISTGILLVGSFIWAFFLNPNRSVVEKLNLKEKITLKEHVK
ncbi:MFS transporter [Priestia megaterium]|uniref:MFS transporter n=1 Tax=Priestia megaterium TaxID=1404 RepID=UPI0018A2DC1F|nr:MFS transporter [Priestia megaterium]